ncbi:MAG: alkaline phosphatase PafA, partial [Chitinophagaceae bacterium]
IAFYDSLGSIAFMRRVLFPLLFLVSSFPALSREVPRPRLVVGIVVDQMRWDYLYRFYNHFGENGFKRLMNEGFRCEQTFINYLPSFTAPGHATIYTGSVPAIHGIAANDWIENGQREYCTEDKTALPVGGSFKWGQMSPMNLKTSTITDELRLATNFRSRVYGVSLKDRSSILPAGHLANGAFWFDDSTGTFTTSSFYSKNLPNWLVRFNEHHSADSILVNDWTLRDAPRKYYQSEPDNSPYEGKFSKQEPSTSFPHKAEYFLGKGNEKYHTVRELPVGDALTFQLAKACVNANKLGQFSDPDFLCISLSAPDYIGHQFGPNSMEVEDTYVRLDAQLAQFLSFLDEKLGKGNYTIFLTSDHGAAHNSRYLNDHKMPAGNLSISSMKKELNTYLKTQTGVDDLVKSLINYQVFFKEENLKRAKQNRAEIRSLIVSWLRQRPEVQFVADLEAGELNTIPEPIRTMMVNGYVPGRSGCIQFIPPPAYYSGYAATGTTHGTWNPYDTHIPLLWYGWGVLKGSTNRHIDMTDIAATLAALLHIQMPNGCVGKVITEIAP